jgi:HAD superfamily phosphoserine phosphatase-like hydrolase
MKCILMDFDGTLTRRDSTRDLILAFLHERPWLLVPTIPLLRRMVFARTAEALQTAKNRCLGRLSRGLPPAGMRRVLARFEAAVSDLLRPELVDLLKNKDIPVVIVTASPDFAVRFLFQTHPVTVIGTRFKCQDEVHTGEIVSPPCYGQHKPFWINLWRAEQGEVRFVQAWSDSTTDMSMMMLAERRIWLCPRETVARDKLIESTDYFWPEVEPAQELMT